MRIRSEVASVFQTAQYMENFGTNQLLVQYRQLPGNRGMGIWRHYQQELMRFVPEEGSGQHPAERSCHPRSPV